MPRSTIAGTKARGAPEHVLHVDLVECEPVLLVGLRGRASVAGSARRCSRARRRVRHRARPRRVHRTAVGVADVGDDRLGVASGRADRRDALVGEVGVDVGDDDARTGRGEGVRDGRRRCRRHRRSRPRRFPPRSISVVTSSRSAARAPRSSRATPPRRARYAVMSRFDIGDAELGERVEAVEGRAERGCAVVVLLHRGVRPHDQRVGVATRVLQGAAQHADAVARCRRPTRP